MAGLLLYGCGQNPFLQRTSAPGTQEEAGIIASCTAVTQAKEYAHKHGVQYRIISEKHQMVEFYEKDTDRLKKNFPRAKFKENIVYDNLIEKFNSDFQASGGNFTHLDQVEATAVNHNGGSGITVAVIDTGVGYQHTDLVNQHGLNNAEIPGNGVDDDGNGKVDDVKGWDFVHGDNDPYDDNGHGTHVAGLVVGAQSGVAINAKFIPIKVLDATGRGDLGSIVSGILYAIDRGAQIINLSLGGSGGSAISSSIRRMVNAVKSAKNNNSLIVAAAGNGGGDGLGDCNDANPIYPASINESNVIAVAAVDQNNILTEYSNFGETSVHVAAPGGALYAGILSTSYCEQCWQKSGYRYMSGTSMATPILSGMLAVLMSENPGKSAIQIKNQLLNHVIKTQELSDKVSSGGYANMRTSLLQI
jgi:subtilisin family serine protease